MQYGSPLWMTAERRCLDKHNNLTDETPCKECVAAIKKQHEESLAEIAYGEGEY